MEERTRKRMHELVEEAAARGETPGVCVLLYERGQETFFGISGYANLEQGELLRRDHIFRMYSMTKPVTAVAVMLLMEEGRLDLGTPVERLLPGFGFNRVVTADKRRESLAEDLRVHHLMNMTSGLTYGGLDTEGERETVRLLLDSENYLDTPEELSTMEFIKRLGAIPLSFRPGTAYRYGLSADVLGAIIERVSGQRLGDFMQERIFGPLGMKDTGFYVPEEKQPRLAGLYRVRAGEGGIIPFRSNALMINNAMKHRPGFESGGAGLVSTIDDYMRFARMLVRGGELDGVRILKKGTVDYLTSGDLTPAQQKGFEESFDLYGFTYQHLLRQMRNPGSASGLGRRREYGWDSWTGCYVACLPEEQAVMVLMEQTAESGTPPLARKLRNLWLNELE